MLHVPKGLIRTPQVEEEVGDNLVQHPNVFLGEIAVAERLGVRGEHALAGPRGAARTPAVWDLGRRHHAEMVLMNELWFAVVPPPSAPTSFLTLLPKASTNLSGAEAFDLSGRSVKDSRQVSRTPKRVCAAARNSSFENGVERKGARSPNEFAKRLLAESPFSSSLSSSSSLPMPGATAAAASGTIAWPRTAGTPVLMAPVVVLGGPRAARARDDEGLELPHLQQRPKLCGRRGRVLEDEFLGLLHQWRPLQRERACPLLALGIFSATLVSFASRVRRRSSRYSGDEAMAPCAVAPSACGSAPA